MELRTMARLIARLSEFINELDQLKAVKVHQRVDQFYYMEKVAELQVLYDRLVELLEKQKAVCELVARVTPSVVESWKRDKRWLMRHGDAYDKAVL